MSGPVGSRGSSLVERAGTQGDVPVDSLGPGPGRRSLVSFQPLVRLLTASMLASPRFPKAPQSPHLRAGFDYTPLSNARSAPLRRLVALASTAVPPGSFQAA